MHIQRLIEALSRPAAYPEPVEDVLVKQTHLSAVFLAGEHAYKVKKPVTLPFVDFGTLEKRRHFCEEEVRLNRRLAPTVYRGVVPIALGRDGLRVEGSGHPVEWAVKMERLPDGASLSNLLARGEVDDLTVEDLARRIAEFHSQAEGGERTAALGRLEVVASNARDNLYQSATQVGVTVGPPVFARLRVLLDEHLGRLGPLIEARAARGVPRDTHGDLRLEHVYLAPHRPPPDDLVIIDCIEFNDRFRLADPVADMAFLVMDLVSRGRPDLARTFAEAYFAATGDDEGRALVPFYAAYRAMVRAKVRGIEAAEAEVPEAGRAEARERARAGWLLALGLLEDPARAPRLVLVGGLPGTGKSMLARGLAERAGFHLVRSDVVRKELAAGRTGLYTPEWDERTYAECLRRAEAVLFDGGRPLVDATFREERRRRDFLRMAERWAVPSLFLVCRAHPDVIRDRLAVRCGDASDADWDVHRRLASLWEEVAPTTRVAQRDIPTDAGRATALAVALMTLADRQALCAIV